MSSRISMVLYSLLLCASGVGATESTGCYFVDGFIKEVIERDDGTRLLLGFRIPCRNTPSRSPQVVSILSPDGAAMTIGIEIQKTDCDLLPAGETNAVTLTVDPSTFEYSAGIYRTIPLSKNGNRNQYEDCETATAASTPPARRIERAPNSAAKSYFLEKGAVVCADLNGLHGISGVSSSPVLMDAVAKRMGCFFQPERQAINPSTTITQLGNGFATLSGGGRGVVYVFANSITQQ